LPAINALTQQYTSPFAGLNPVFGSQISRATLLEPFPEFGAISIQRSRGYTLQAGYTWSKYMEATEFQNASDARPYRVISDSDRTHVFTMSGVWELNFFRAEVYNTMYHPSFDAPNTSPTNSSFGTVTAVVSEPRNWQLALKVTFQGSAAQITLSTTP
jgi:hypothetical protein